MSSTHAADAARHFLEKTGLEPTLNRILVLAALTGSDRPLSAREVFENVSRDHRLNRVTAYRILDLFVEKGVVNRVTFGEGVRHFCLGGHHSHFHCIQCDAVLCLDDEALHFNRQAVGNDLPFEVSSVELHLEGICERCRRHTDTGDSQSLHR